MDQYIALIDAETFVAEYVLNSDAWDCEDDDARKTKALKAATIVIDRLNFVGRKADPDQDLQFPRGTDTVVPTDIERACVYIAIELLDGFDPNIEFSNLQLIEQDFGGAKVKYSRSFSMEHLVAGIPSLDAWRHLKPYIRDPRQINLARID